MDYKIDIEGLDVCSASFTSMPNQHYYMYIDFPNSCWHLFEGKYNGDVDHALLAGRANVKTSIYKLLPKVLQFIDDLDHKRAQEIVEKHREHDGQPDEAQEWHDFNPDC